MIVISLTPKQIDTLVDSVDSSFDHCDSGEEMETLLELIQILGFARRQYIQENYIATSNPSS